MPRQTVPITVLLSAEEVEQLDRLVQRPERTRSTIIREALRQYLARRRPRRGKPAAQPLPPAPPAEQEEVA